MGLTGKLGHAWFCAWVGAWHGVCVHVGMGGGGGGDGVGGVNILCRVLVKRTVIQLNLQCTLLDVLI